jgi:hypothetical protein
VTADKVSLWTFCWGDYWDRYSQRWIESVKALDPAPLEVVVGSDRVLDLPDGWRQVPISEPFMWDGALKVAEACRGEWLAGVMMDDLMPSDALVDLDLSGDVECSVAVDSTGFRMVPTRERYENCLNEPWYPLSGYQIIRRDVFLRIPMRPVVWADWVLSFEWWQANLDVRFSDRVRYLYQLSPEQNSNVKDSGAAMKNIELMKRLVREGGVKPGAVWPPVPL